MKLTKLSNNKMGQVLANLFKKDVLSIADDGKVQLSDEERETVKKTFGEKFLTTLENTVFDETASNEEVNTLFNAAVEAKTASLQTELAEEKAKNKQLQESVNVLIAEPEPKPKTEKVRGSQKTQVFKINASAPHNVTALAVLGAENPFTLIHQAEDSSIDITDLKAELSMAMPIGTKLDLLNKYIYGGYDDIKHFRKIESNGKDYLAATVVMSEVSQQFSDEWTPKGTGKFTPLTVKYRRHKINVSINPTEVIGSWLIDLYEQGKTPDQQPLIQYMAVTHILPRVGQDITYTMLGKGKFVEASNVQEGQEGTASAESMDGIETILVDAKKAGNTKINFFRNAKNLLEIEDDGEFLEAIHTYATSISPLFKSAIMKIKCSQQIIDRYNACDFKVYAKYTGEKIGNSIRFSKFTLEPMECMYSSPILIATPDVNMVMLVDRANAKNCINDIQKRDYKVRIFGEYSLSVGFLISEAVFAYVPDGYDPSAAVISDPLKYSGNWYNGGDGAAEASDEGETE
ncbi:MAG: hypothetical protein IJ023_00270 [Bacteroidales bacterium]|nr:hypothetical protein [Bacteroidales bacterium]